MAQCNCKLWLHQHRCTVNESVRRIAYAHFEDTHFPKQRHDALLFHSPFHWCKCVTGWFQKRCNSRGPFGNSRWRLRDLCCCWPTLLIFIGLKPQSNKSCWIYLIVPCFLLSWSLVQHYTILIQLSDNSVSLQKMSSLDALSLGKRVELWRCLQDKPAKKRQELRWSQKVGARLIR